MKSKRECEAAVTRAIEMALGHKVKRWLAYCDEVPHWWIAEVEYADGRVFRGDELIIEACDQDPAHSYRIHERLIDLAARIGGEPLALGWEARPLPRPALRPRRFVAFSSLLQ